MALPLLAAAMAAAAAAKAIFSGAKAAESLFLKSGEESNPESRNGEPVLAPFDGVWGVGIGGIGRIGDPKPNCPGTGNAAPRLNGFFSWDRFSVFRILLLFGVMSGKKRSKE